MKKPGTMLRIGLSALIAAVVTAAAVHAEEAAKKASSYTSPVVTESFSSIMAKMKAAKPGSSSGTRRCSNNATT